MAGGISEYLANKLIDHAGGTAEFTMPTQVFLAAYIGTPGAGGAEVSAEGYARVTTTFLPADTGAASNNADALFAEATNEWGTIDFIAEYDAATGGNMGFWGPLTTAKYIGTNDQLKIASGNWNHSFTI